MTSRSAHIDDANAAAEPLAAKRPDAVPLRDAFWYWLRLGCLSFGGPAGQIAMMHAELVERRRWISEQRFLHALNYCMVLPGPEAQQLATYIGWLMHRTRGGIIAGGLFVLPSLLVLVILSWIYVALGHVPAVAGALYGIKPAVTAIVIQAAVRIGKRALRGRVQWAIAGAAFLAIAFAGLPFPVILLAAAAAGAIAGRLSPGSFAAPAAHATGAAVSATMIDDDIRLPHTRFSWRHCALVVGVSLALWAGALGMLAAAFGWHGTLTQMGWFFTKSALLTFGGAYAVLPYVFQGAVQHYAWLDAGQMIDGLALGETTPGPLIMVVAFVGFVGAWQQAVLGHGALLLAGIAGAVVATWFTFLPSFLFILAGGPAVESTRGDINVAAPLGGITAAVCGVILNLALFFGYHTLWPGGFGSHFEWPAAALGVAATVALLRYKAGVIPVIVVCALVGLAARAAGL